jgi:hypothetical protein
MAKLNKRQKLRRKRKQLDRAGAQMEKRVLDANKREAISALGLSLKAMLTSRTSSTRSVFVVEEVAPMPEVDEAEPK